MKALIAGTGSIGRRHVASIRSLDPAADLVLLRRSAGQDEYSDSLRAKVVTRVEDALALRPDIAVIAGPSSGHAELVLAMLAARIPMYVEKPVATDAAQIAAIRSAIAGQKPPASICGCNLRFLPAVRAIRQELHAGRIGRVVRATLQVGQWLPDWRPASDYRLSYSARRDLGGGVLLDLVHELDAARWLLGDLDVLAAVGGRFSRLEIDSEDAAWVLLSRSGGPAVAVGVDYVARRPIRRYEFIGEEGTLMIDLIARRAVLESKSGIEQLPMPEAAFDVASTYRAAMAEFIDAVVSGSATSQGLEEGLQSAALAVRANELIRQ